MGKLAFGILALLLVVGLTGCSASNDNQSIPELEQRRSGFKVSVETGGKPVADFSTQLVHRVVLTPEQIDTVMASWPDRLYLPFEAQPDRDTWGKICGIKVTRMKSDSNLPNLGLKLGDRVTAVGVSHTKESRDLWKLFDQLRRNSEASLTLEREGKPHKILYYLSKAGSVS